MGRHLVDWLVCFLYMIPAANNRYLANMQGSMTRQIQLEAVCNGDNKVVIDLQKRSTSAVVLTFTGKTAASQFQCHLELEVLSKGYGIVVFFEEMHLGGSWPNQCGGDYVQFGRDRLIVTTFTSKKFCGTVEAPVPKSQELGHHKGLSFPKTPLTDKNRLYVESEDREMDVWLNVNTGRLPKNLTLVVTPFKKSCMNEYDLLKWRKCQKYSRRSYCVKKDLFCDGRVNCPVGETEATDEKAIDCEALYAKTQPGRNIPKVVIIIIVIALAAIIVFILYTAARKFGVFGKVRSYAETQIQPSRSSSRPRDSSSSSPVIRESYRRTGSSHTETAQIPGDPIPETIPMSQLPLHPPPYSEVVGYPQEDPPKYSDIMAQSSDIVGR